MKKPQVLMRFLSASSAETVLIEPRGYLGDSFDAYKRGVAGARFDFDSKTYRTTTAEQALRISHRLGEAGFDVLIAADVRTRIDAERCALIEQLQASARRLPALEEKLAGQGRYLYPFQRQDVMWMASRRNAINANDMGLGKSLETLCALPAANDAGVIVVGPVVAKGVWRRETGKWRDDYRATVLEGRSSFRWPERGEVVACNYDILPPADSLPSLPAAMKGRLFAVGDEIQLLTNHRSERSKRFSAILNLSSRAMGLTGTPLPNKPDELWTILKMFDLAHEAYGSHREFARCFSGKEKHYKTKKGELKYAGYEWGTPDPEAGERLKPVLVRHLKEDVLDQLPEKTYRVIDVELTDAGRKEIESILEPGDAEIILRAKDIADIPFSKFATFRRVLAGLKYDAARELAEVHGEAEEPIIVFSAHLDPLKKLAKKKGWALITGTTKNRSEIEDLFQSGKLLGIAASIKATGVALTLTRAVASYFIDRSWTPADNDQSEDRIHRIGLTHGVVITDLVLDHPLDLHVHAVNAAKKHINNESVERAREMKVMPMNDLASVVPVAPALADDGGATRPAKTAAEEAGMVDLMDVARLTGVDAKRDFKMFAPTDKAAAHSLATDFLVLAKLSDKQWYYVVMLARKYQKHIQRWRELNSTP